MTETRTLTETANAAHRRRRAAFDAARAARYRWYESLDGNDADASRVLHEAALVADRAWHDAANAECAAIRAMRAGAIR